MGGEDKIVCDSTTSEAVTHEIDEHQKKTKSLMQKGDNLSVSNCCPVSWNKGRGKIV